VYVFTEVPKRNLTGNRGQIIRIIIIDIAKVTDVKMFDVLSLSLVIGMILSSVGSSVCDEVYCA